MEAESAVESGVGEGRGRASDCKGREEGGGGDGGGGDGGGGDGGGGVFSSVSFTHSTNADRFVAAPWRWPAPDLCGASTTADEDTLLCDTLRLITGERVPSIFVTLVTVNVGRDPLFLMESDLNIK